MSDDERVISWFEENYKGLLLGIVVGLSILFSYFSLKKFRDKLDPRKYNGAIFLGLKGPVVKSHGATDSLGFSYSVELCYKIAKGNLNQKIKKNLDIYNYQFLKKNNIRFVVLCENLSISGIGTAGIPDIQKRTLILNCFFSYRLNFVSVYNNFFYKFNLSCWGFVSRSETSFDDS